jgi:hypothetical protein
MRKHQGHKLRTVLFTLLASSLLYGSSFFKLPVIDGIADDYFSESIKAATISYATARGVNAVVSVVKESHLELAPAGVGVTIAAGQVLDPIDDMTERLSSIMVAAITSLGIQKIGFEISKVLAFKAIAVVLLLTIPLLWLNSTSVTALLQLATKLCLILLLLRFMLPASALISDSLYTNWLQPGIEDSVEKLTIVSKSYNEMSSMPPQNKGFFSSMTAGATDEVEKTKKAFMNMVENAENIVSALLQLMTAYLAIFLVQVLLLPLFMLWVLISLFKSRILNSLSEQIANRALNPTAS